MHSPDPVAFDLETELIPSRKTVLSRGGKPANITPYVTPRPVIASISYGDDNGIVYPMRYFYELFALWVEYDRPIICHNGASFDLDVLYTHGPVKLRPIIVEALDKGLIYDTKLIDWLVRLARGVFDMPQYKPDTRKWFVPQSRVRSLKVLALEYLGLELDKDPAVRCGYGQFLGHVDKDITKLPEKFKVYAAQDALVTYQVGRKLMAEADSIDPQSRKRQVAALPNPHGTKWRTAGSPHGPLSCLLQARASFVAHQMDKQGVCVNQPRAAELRQLFEKDEGPLQEELVDCGLGRYKPVPKAERQVDTLPLDTEDIKEWRKI